MTEEEKRRKRRTPEEIRADLQAKIRVLDEDEKREVIRLLAGVADDLQKASTFKCAPQPEVNQAIAAAKAALKKLGDLMAFDLERRAIELADMGGDGWLTPEKAIQLAREAADARAEEIAQECDHRSNLVHGSSICGTWTSAAEVARSFISKPETREQRLEKALREIVSDGGGCDCSSEGSHQDDAEQHAVGCARFIARRALEGK